VKGILLLGGHDPVIVGRGKAARGIEVVMGDRPQLLWEQTAIVEAATRLPFDLLPAAWAFLERWDAAVPMWKPGVLAADVGTAEEREATETQIRDLRVPLLACELLFVRRNEAGQALIAAWLEEMERGSDRRLAFLRANYRVKPRLCVLPASWLVGNRPAGATNGARPKSGRGPLVKLELAPGRFVKVHAGDEEKARAQFERQRKGRRSNGNHQ
jgi:hypothetical protein